MLSAMDSVEKGREEAREWLGIFAPSGSPCVVANT